MLTKFEVKGFKGFENLFVLDFSNTREYKFNSDCILKGNIKNLIMYGRNSIGKSNFGLAIMDIVSHLDDKNIGPKLYENYLNINCDKAEFKYQFRFEDNIIDYHYSKKDLKDLLWETIYVNDKLILTYNYENKKGDFTGAKKISPTLNYSHLGDGSLLRYFLTNSALDEKHPLFLFQKFISSMLWFSTLEENRYVGYKTKSDDYYKFILDDKTIQNKFENMLNKIGIKEKLSSRKGLDGKKELYFKNNNKFLPFFEVASSGTRALYTLFYWLTTAKNASFICIDEFDAYYHFELAEQVINILKDMPETQSMVTTHNTNLLTNKIMRPDCYFVLTKDRLTCIANATKMELREGHNLEKLYIAGEFNG